MYPKEFVEFLVCEGVHLFSREEIEAKFKAMDVDNSGFLSIGEVHSAFHRLGDLFAMYREFCERTGADDGIATNTDSAAELCGDYRGSSCDSGLLDAFTKQLMLGDDLVGSTQ